MRKAVVAFLAFAGLEAMITVTGQGCVTGLPVALYELRQQPTATATFSPPQATKFSPLPTVTGTPPARPTPKVASPTPNLSSLVSAYYTVGHNPDNSVEGDLLITRYYVHDPISLETRVIASVEGIIMRIINEGNVYSILISRISNTQKPAYASFVAQALPPVDGHVQTVIINSNPEAKVKVGFTGEFPTAPPRRPDDPFKYAQLANYLHGDSGSAIVSHTADDSSTVHLVARVRVADECMKPVHGSALVEQVILDASSLQSRGLLDTLKARQTLQAGCGK